MSVSNLLELHYLSTAALRCLLLMRKLVIEREVSTLSTADTRRLRTHSAPHPFLMKTGAKGTKMARKYSCERMTDLNQTTAVKIVPIAWPLTQRSAFEVLWRTNRTCQHTGMLLPLKLLEVPFGAHGCCLAILMRTSDQERRAKMRVCTIGG